MGKIMGSRGQIAFIPIHDRDSNPEQLVLSGHAVQNNNMSVCLDFTFSFKSKNSGLFYVIKKVKGTNVNSQNFLPTDYWKILKSAMRPVGMNPTKFPTHRIPSIFLCNGNFDHPIQIEIHSTSNRACEGVINTTVNQLISGNSLFEFGDVNVEIRASVAKEFTFLDYLRGGVQISLSIGIDFTGSNGHPRDHNSLHSIHNSNSPNQYQKAIRACGDILAYYDYDQSFPVYGYGAVLPYSGMDVNHCFPLSLNNEVNIKTIDGVLEVYRNNMPKLDFSGPTYFSPLLNQIVSNVKSNPDPNIYNILLILTDGMINDMDATINALVEGSFLPLSVIIVGVGNANFADMDVLDADGKEGIVDQYGRRAARDINQFVPFSKFKENHQKLAEEVLFEIPTQLVDYYRSINKQPGDPIIIKNI